MNREYRFSPNRNSSTRPCTQHLPASRIVLSIRSLARVAPRVGAGDGGRSANNMLLRFCALIVGLCLSGCVEYYNVEDASLHSEAETAQIDYVWTQELFTISLSDSKRELLDVKNIQGTAFLWNDTISFQLIPQGMAFNGSTPYDPRLGRVKSLIFYMKLDNPRTKKEHFLYPLTPGVYNISMQFNGVSGVYTLCGRFRIVKKSEPYHDGLR